VNASGGAPAHPGAHHARESTFRLFRVGNALWISGLARVFVRKPLRTFRNALWISGLSRVFVRKPLRTFRNAR
jgi:hypothetical protein